MRLLVNYDPQSGQVMAENGIYLGAAPMGLTGLIEYKSESEKPSKADELLKLKKAGFKLTDIYKMHERRIL